MLLLMLCPCSTLLVLSTRPRVAMLLPMLVCCCPRRMISARGRAPCGNNAPAPETGEPPAGAGPTFLSNPFYFLCSEPGNLLPAPHSPSPVAPALLRSHLRPAPQPPRPGWPSNLWLLEGSPPGWRPRVPLVRLSPHSSSVCTSGSGSCKPACAGKCSRAGSRRRSCCLHTGPC